MTSALLHHLRGHDPRGSARVPELFVNADGAAMTRARFEYILDKHTGARLPSDTSDWLGAPCRPSERRRCPWEGNLIGDAAIAVTPVPRC